MQVGIDPKIDYAFKRLFGVEKNSALLIDLLNAVLDPAAGEQIVHVHLLNPFNAKEAWDDKLSIVDIKARDQTGRLFQIEMQMLSHKFLPERLLYYWSHLFQDQLHEGEDYGLLRPAISICFVNDRLFADAPDWRLRFELWDAERKMRLTDRLAIHVFELPKFDRQAEQLTSELERWLYFLRHGDQLDPDELPNTLQVQPISQALEELTMLTQNDLERERYEARRKNLLDELSVRKEYERGLKQTREQALAEGRAEGRAEGLITAIQLAQQVLKQPVTPAEQLAAHTVDELQRLAAQLEQEVLSR